MSEARQRVLDTAERLFHMHGYTAVTMRDIAADLGMKQASLYYHVPAGKEQLFVEVTRRVFERHRAGLTAAIEQAENDLEAQMQAAARWVFSQPPMSLFKMMESDMPELSTENQQMLSRLAHESLFVPLGAMFATAVERGETRPIGVMQMTGTFLTILEGVSFAERQGQFSRPPEEVADEIIDVLLNGLRQRQTAVAAEPREG